MAEKEKPWVAKHSPKKLKDVQGQDKAVALLKEFVVGFKKKKKKAVILHGPPGSGKTCAAHALGKECGYEVIEVNASDSRNADQISSVIGEASRQMSLFFPKGKIILVDEIDGVSGQQDRGGVPELAKIMEETKFPMVLTANDPFDKKFTSLRKNAEMIEFEIPSFTDVFAILKRVADAEGLDYDEDALKMLARRAGGDVRAGINDLQMLISGQKKLKREDLDSLDDRERTEEITTALTKVFKTTDPIIAKASFQSVEEDLKECALWVDHNLPKEYEKPADLARAYDYVSKADIMNRRIMRWQHWRFLAYVNDYLSAGVAVSKDEKYKKMVEYERTQRLLTIWMANRKYQKRLAIAEKI
ncbi:TPA: replication factor C large subunit, partial [Candidatus Woesearchaeota archaeon]|nr:replication factor C large subunit [Candidatus Woesearchaeota archaeon]